MFKVIYCSFCILFCLLLSPVMAGKLADHTKTDNQSDFTDPDTADLRADARCPAIAGQWSYHHWDQNNNRFNNLKRGNPEVKRFAGKWVIDNRKKESTWWIGPKGQMRSDGRSLASVYTIDTNEAGRVRIQGQLHIKKDTDCHLQILQTTDSQLVHVDGKHIKTLFDSQEAKSSKFNLIIDVQAGNDICFVFVGRKLWWVTRKLTASLHQVPASQ